MKVIELEKDKTKSFFSDRYLLVLLIIALSARIYSSFFTYIIKNDSVAFIQNAKYFASGDFSSGLGHDYHPLYSIFMAVLYKVVPNMELSGTILSVSFGTLTVIVFYLIGKGVFDKKVSYVSALILAFHPYAVRFSADVLSESTYFFFFLSALGSGFFAVTNRRLLLFALTGVCSALAYLTRPEGIGILIIVAFFYVSRDFVRIKTLWKEKLVAVLILIVSFLVFSMPYLIYIKNETGHWRLTKKKEITRMAGVDELINGQINDTSVEGNDTEKENSGNDVIRQSILGVLDIKLHTNCIVHIVKRYISTFHPFLFLFFIIGVKNWSGIKIEKERLFGFFITLVIALYLIILYRLSITYLAISDDSFLYPSRRHLMPLVIPAMFCVGLGVSTAGAWIYEKFQNGSTMVGLKELLKSTGRAQLLVLIIVIGVLLPKTLKPQGFDKLGIKVVGRWVKDHSYKPTPVILSTSVRNAYYAGGRHVQLANIHEALDLARSTKADYIAISQRECKDIEALLLQSIKNGEIELAYKYPENPETSSLKKHEMYLYKVLP